jgi:hypothetical protein
MTGKRNAMVTATTGSSHEDAVTGGCLKIRHVTT